VIRKGRLGGCGRQRVGRQQLVGRRSLGLSFRPGRARGLGWWCLDSLKKPAYETGIQSRTVAIVYAYVRGAVELDSALYSPDDFSALL